MNENLTSRTWAEVDLNAIACNIGIFRKKVTNGAELMGVVKADAYGHGVLGILPTLMESGVTRLAVALLDEALELRRQGVSLPILTLGYTDPSRAEEVLQNDVAQTVYSLEAARALSLVGQKQGKTARVHIKIDTGMGRVGFPADEEAVNAADEIRRMPNLFIEGIFTHFACADEEDPSYTYQQFQKYMKVIDDLKKRGISIPLRHVCNSAATLRFPEMHLDMVRIGILMYGMSPSPFCSAARNGFRPAMTLKTKVVLVKEVEKSQSVSYGRKFIAETTSRIATLPIGYADGYGRILSNRAPVLINGKRYRIAGNICMDMCMADVTAEMDAEDGAKADVSICGGPAGAGECARPVAVGDEAVLFGYQGETQLDIDEIAALRGTINYELTCNVNRRVPKIYLKDGRIVGSKCELLGI